MNHNLFTIGDGNDAIVERDSDEDDDDDDDVVVDDVFDIDGVDKHSSPVHSKFANFAFNNEKVIVKPKIDNNKKANNPSHIETSQQTQQHHHQQQQQQHMLQKQQQSENGNEQNTEQVSHQGQPKATNTNVAPHSTNGQMNYKLSSKYIEHLNAIKSSK